MRIELVDEDFSASVSSLPVPDRWQFDFNASEPTTQNVSISRADVDYKLTAGRSECNRGPDIEVLEQT